MPLETSLTNLRSIAQLLTVTYNDKMHFPGGDQGAITKLSNYDFVAGIIYHCLASY